MDQPLVIFDLDGTLVDSLPGIVTCLSETLTSRGLRPAREELTVLIGAPLHAIYEGYGFSGPDLEACVDHYRVLYAEGGSAAAEIFPGVLPMLRCLFEAGRSLAVATMKAEPVAEKFLGEHGLDEYFSCVIGSRPDGSRGHKQELITEVLRRAGYSPHEAVMIGDREMDILGAKACGVASVGAAWGYGVEKSWPSPAPTPSPTPRRS